MWAKLDFLLSFWVFLWVKSCLRGCLPVLPVTAVFVQISVPVQTVSGYAVSVKSTARTGLAMPFILE